LAASGAKRKRTVVPPSEGNEARWDEGQEVGAFDSTDEAGERARAEPVEGSESRIVELLEGNMPGTQEPDHVSTKQQRIATLGKRFAHRSFTSLAHHMDLSWLEAAYRRTRKDGAVGIDGQTAAAYEQDLMGNLQSLLERAKSGCYRAPPVRRVHIPKGDGRTTRPIGIPTLEDKVLQRAVTMLLEPLFEQDFEDSSYGFRPGRSAHQALDELWRGLMPMGGGWVLELDIQAFFDRLDHWHLRSFLRQRVRDGVICRLIDKWLKAGVLDAGQLIYPQAGTPQGGVISPLLANIYLHVVLDQWFEREVKPRLKGRGFLVRFADDAVIGFATEADARKVLEVLPKRFAKYGLTLHSTKTCLVRFIAPARQPQCKPETFDLLGFTHYWGLSRRGQWIIKRRTSKARFRRSLANVKRWCRQHRHKPLADQHRALSRKLLGYYGYYGITGNSRALNCFRYHVERVWIKWLGRRSQRARLPWDRAGKLLARYPLPPARIVHSVYRS
jgi:group II intron reverse transcriptase/maturase